MLWQLALAAAAPLNVLDVTGDVLQGLGALNGLIPGLDPGQLTSEWLEPQSQPSAPRAPSERHRPLVWGDLNFIHTTDTHAWLAGHLLEPGFSADWGDFISFSSHLRQAANDQGLDLLLVDTGDRHDGNGLGDATKPNGVYTGPLFGQADHDIITIGNHELYKGDVALAEYAYARDNYGDRFVVSNIEVFNDGKWINMGYKYRLFTTPVQGTRILGLGFLFDFTGNDAKSKVTPVAEEIQKTWFQSLLHNEIADDGIDVIVIAGHIPVRGTHEFGILVDAIRTYNSDIPIVMFGGHSHIRDFKVYDGNAGALESGRFLETIGFASLNFTNVEPAAGRSIIERSYIDFNRNSLAFHSDKDSTTFDTDKGRAVSNLISDQRRELDLDKVVSCVPQTYYTDRAPYPSKDSIFSLLTDHVLPLLEWNRTTTGRYVYLNTGGIRFDLFKGLYTKDTGYIISPFDNQWLFISDVPIDIAREILPIINQETKVLDSKSRFRYDQANIKSSPHRKLNPGYLTSDDYGIDGDDTPHLGWDYYTIPNAVQSVQNVTKETTHVDLVFHDFMAPFILKALKVLGNPQFTPAYHGGEKIIDLIPQYLNTFEPIEECRP